MQTPENGQNQKPQQATDAPHPGKLHFRYARMDDLAAIIALLADDEKGRQREIATNPPDEKYRTAFALMEGQSSDTLPNRYLLACLDGQIVGCLQLTLIAGLSRQGRLRAQIEAVRIASAHRGQKIGQSLIMHAISMSKSLGATLVQLTTDKTRHDAHRFYERLGFIASHDGMKYEIAP